MEALDLAKQKGAVIIGPNTPGIMIPDLIKVGIMPPMPFKAGKIAVLSKSGTLLYEISDALTNSGFGQSITIGIGGDPVNGTRLIDAFDMIKDIPDLEGLVVVGEIGGDSEEILAQRIIDSGFNKPTVAYIAGRAAPKEKRMGMQGQLLWELMVLQNPRYQCLTKQTFQWQKDLQKCQYYLQEKWKNPIRIKERD